MPVIYVRTAAGQDIKSGNFELKKPESEVPHFLAFKRWVGLAGGDSAACHFDNQMGPVSR